MDEDNTIILTKQQENVLYQDACQIIERTQAAAYRAVDVTLIKRNWLLGLRIQHEVLKDKRAEYGERVVKILAVKLTERYGTGFTWRNLYNFMDFYNKHTALIFNLLSNQGILHAVSAKSENIFQSLTRKYPIRLTWTHYRIVLQESNKEARYRYEQKAA